MKNDKFEATEELYSTWADEKLVKATTIDRNEYYPEAINMMLKVLEKRGVSQQQFTAVQMDVEKQKDDDIETVRKKYIKQMIFGFILQYLGLLGIVLGNAGVLSKDNAAYSGSAMIETVGVILILVSTYKVCKFLGFGLIKILFISFLNINLGINILAIFPYLNYILKSANKLK